MDNENIEKINQDNLQAAEEQQTSKYKSRSIVNNSAKMKKTTSNHNCGRQSFNF